MFAESGNVVSTRRRLGVGMLILGLSALPASAQEHPNFSGLWDLNAERSDDAVQEINEAAGTTEIQGQSGPRGNTLILPKGNERSEVERLELRNWMLQMEQQFRELEIVHEGNEFKTYYGEDGVRIFYLNRPHVRTDMKGRKLDCKTRWEGEQLVIEQTGADKTRVFEVYTLLPGGKQLILAVRWESKWLKQPLTLRSVYDLVDEES